MQKLTKEQGIVITGFTGILCCSFPDFHEDVEKRTGKSVYTHEFGDKEFSKWLRGVYREDFMELIGAEKKGQQFE
jgi:hypothetical protein